MKRRVKYIGQMQENECAYCCIAMIMSVYGDKSSILDIRKNEDVGRDGVNIARIMHIFREKGFESKAYKIEDITKLPNNTLPVIAYWNQNHFIIVEKIKKSSVVITDPNSGRRTILIDEFNESFSDIVICAKPTERFIPNKKEINVWSLYIDYIINQKKAVGKLFGLSFAYFSVILFIPILLNYVLNLIQSGTEMIYIISVLLVAVVLYFSINVFQGLEMLNFGILMNDYLYKKMLGKIFNIPYEFFEARTTGDIIYRFNILTVIRDFITEVISKGVLNLLLVGVLLIYYFINSIWLGLIISLFIVVNFLLLYLITKKLSEKSYAEVQSATAFNGLQYESISAINTIKSTGREEEKEKELWSLYNSYISKYKKRSEFSFFYAVVNSSFMTFGPIFILILGFVLVQYNTFSLGGILSLFSVSGILFGSVNSVFQMFATFNVIKTYLYRVYDILSYKNEDLNKTGVDAEITGSITLKDIGFRYKGQERLAIKNIDLQINAGEFLGIVGDSGSGKSTLGKIISTLYKASEGNIKFDGIDIKEYNLRSLRKKICFIPQEALIFNASIKDNISMGSKFTENEIINASKEAEIHNFIDSLPMKYETLISEHGLNLSGGQRQRIILARAFVNKPKVLILDESTNALDIRTERKISKIIADKKITRIIITHREETLESADKIIKINDGNLELIR